MLVIPFHRPDRATAEAQKPAWMIVTWSVVIGLHLIWLLNNTSLAAQTPRPKVKVAATPTIKGWWQSLADPRSRIQFNDTVAYSYYDRQVATTQRYWLVADCKSTKAVPYIKAEYIVFKDPQVVDTDCAGFIANDDQHLGWIDNSTGHRQSFKRIKGPVVSTATPH